MDTTKPISQILATPGSVSQLLKRTEGQPSETLPEGRRKLTAKDADWAEKWLKLQPCHPQVEEMTEAAVRFCAEYYRSPANGRLLALIGNNGTGKTRCAEHLLAWARHVAPSMQFVPRPGVVQTPDVRFHHWPTLLDSLKNGSWDLVDYCEQAHLLILDELGGAHDPTGLGTDKLCRILSRRERKWTLITSNLMPEEWQGSFDRRVLSRLIRNSEIVLLDEARDYSTLDKPEARMPHNN